MATKAATASTPSWEFMASAAVHVLAFAIVVLARCGAQDGAPLFKPEDVMVVEMSGPPANATRMPQKAERAPDPVAGAREPTVAEPPPPKQSDMAFQTPDAKVAEGDPKADLERDRLIADMRRRALLENLDAPVGTTDRAATSPEGTGDVGATASGGVRDPELARWVAECKRRVGANWHPLLAIVQQNPNLSVVVRVDVDASGQKTNTPEIAQPSGNASFDEAARRAVDMTPSLPPPPARFTEGVTATMKFDAKEAL